MSQDIFLKINGIEGESQDSDHKNEIEVLAFNWKAFQESTMHAGSGGGAGKATVEDLEFDHYIDRSSPNLMKYCLTGKHVQERSPLWRAEEEGRLRSPLHRSPHSGRDRNQAPPFTRIRSRRTRRSRSPCPPLLTRRQNRPPSANSPTKKSTPCRPICRFRPGCRAGNCRRLKVPFCAICKKDRQPAGFFTSVFVLSYTTHAS